jgi:hypothetical protein
MFMPESIEPAQENEESSKNEVFNSELMIPASLIQGEAVIASEAIKTLVTEDPERVLTIWENDRQRVHDFYSKKEEYRHQESVERAARQEKVAEREENTKRLGMGLIFATILSVLIYAGITADKASFDKILTAALAAFGGAGAVATFAGKKNKDEN